MREAEAAGLTSVPGLVKGLIKRPKETLKKGIQHAGTGGKLMAGADIAMSAPHIADPSTQAGTGEKALETLGSTGGYLIGSRLPLLGSLLFASGTGAVGRYLGRGLDKLRGHTPPSGAVQEQIPVPIGRAGREQRQLAVRELLGRAG